MKVEFPDHPKFLRLVRLLGEPEPHVLGYCVFLWRRCWQTGKPVFGDQIDIEASAGYRGEIGRFTTAALDAKLIEERSGELWIHDYWDHAPSYVKKRLCVKGYAPKGQEHYCGHKHCLSLRRLGANATKKGNKSSDKPPKKTRPRNLLFDAIAEVTVSDPTIKRIAAKIGRAASEISKADPPYTPEDVREFGKRFAVDICGYANDESPPRKTPHIDELVNWIPKIRAPHHEGKAARPRSHAGGSVKAPHGKYDDVDAAGRAPVGDPAGTIPGSGIPSEQGSGGS